MFRKTRFLLVVLSLTATKALADCPTSPAPDLLACWDFEGASPFNDKAGNHHLSAVANAHVDETGTLVLNGSGDCARTQDNGGADLAGLVKMSVSIWFKPSPLQTPCNSNDDCLPEGTPSCIDSFCSRREALLWNDQIDTVYGIRILEDARIRFTTQGYSDFDATRRGAWNHYVVTFDGSNGTFSHYLNGRSVGNFDTTATSIPELVPPPGVFAIGQRWSDSSGTWYTGLIDDVGVYGGALDATEVHNLYESGQHYTDAEDLGYLLPSQTMTWNISPATSDTNRFKRRDIIFNVVPPVPNANWYRVDRMVDALGNRYFVEENEHYTNGIWFRAPSAALGLNSFQFATSLLATQGGSDSEPLVGSAFLQMTAWGNKSDADPIAIGGERIKQVDYDHTFAELAFVVHVCDKNSTANAACADYLPLGDGEAVLVAEPQVIPPQTSQDVEELLAQIEMYAWVVEDEVGPGIYKERADVTATPAYRVAFGKSGAKHMRFDGARNGTAYDTPQRGVKTGGAATRTALVVPPFVLGQLPWPVDPHELPSIPGDLQLALTRKSISVFPGGSVYLPLGGANPDYIELDLPNDQHLSGPVSVLPFTSHDGNYRYVLCTASGAPSDPDYSRYRLCNTSSSGNWDGSGRVLPLFFESCPEGPEFPIYLHACDANTCSDQTMRITCKAIPHPHDPQAVWPPERLHIGITWAAPDLFMPFAESSFYTIYKALGFNTVPYAGTHWVSDFSSGAGIDGFKPEDRQCSQHEQWCNLVFGPEHSTFELKSTSLFEMLTWTADASCPAYIANVSCDANCPYCLPPDAQHNYSRCVDFASCICGCGSYGCYENENVSNCTLQGISAGEILKRTNALEFHQTTGLVDLAYDGSILTADLNQLTGYVNATQPEYIFIDSESYPTAEQWIENVQYSQNALSWPSPVCTTATSWEDRARCIAGQFLDRLAGSITGATGSPSTKVGFYDSRAALNEGYLAFAWEDVQRNQMIPQPSLYGAQKSIRAYSELIRSNRTALPPTYDPTGSGPERYELMPWITSGTWGDVEPSQLFDVITHTFLNGGTGFSFYYWGDISDMEYYLSMARAIAAVSPYEDIIMDGALAYNDFSNVENATLSAMKGTSGDYDGSYLVALTPNDVNAAMSFSLNTGPWDLIGVLDATNATSLAALPYCTGGSGQFTCLLPAGLGSKVLVISESSGCNDQNPCTADASNPGAQCVHTAFCETPTTDPTGINKSRFISFSVPCGVSPPETALRVKFTSLYHPPGGATPFTLFEGQSMYVGEPTEYVETLAPTTYFVASKLQCTPYYQDWSTISLLHVTGEAIVPSSSYEVKNLAASCQGHEASCTAVSAPLTIATALWADVSSDDVVNFLDISSVVSKFKNQQGAPIYAQAKLAAGFRGLINIQDSGVTFFDISTVVAAFKGVPYLYNPGKCTGNQTNACRNSAECWANGPCILCP